MKAVPISEYILFGTGFRYLQDVKKGRRIHGKGTVLATLRKYMRNLSDLKLVVTKRMSEGRLRKIIEGLEEEPAGATLSESQADDLNAKMTGIRATLVAETSGQFAYIVTDKRLETRKLLENVGSLFADGVFLKLSSISATDFEEAAKCIAFDRSTAAAFHLLRGTEGVLQDLYLHRVKKSRVKPLMWGPMTEHLRKRKKLPTDLLDNLDVVRRNYRNPTQHPQLIYDIDSAQDLFGLCTDVINRMAKLLPAP